MILMIELKNKKARSNMLYTVRQEVVNQTIKRSLNDLVHRATDGFLLRHASLATGLCEARRTT
jgi:hypothetical protein